MIVESAVEISKGVLITPPNISSFSNIVLNVKKITRGSLFIAINTNDIFEAIQNGAYGIIFDKPTQIIDSEIAWIKVDSITNTILRLLKYKVLNSENEFYFVNSFQYSLLELLAVSKEVVMLKSSLINNFSLIFNANSNSIFISKDKKFIDQIAPIYIDSKQIIETDFDIIKSSVFETSFRYHKRYYEFAKVPKLFIDDFIKILSLLDRKGIRYTLDDLDYTSHFYPVFVNKSLRAKEFGESDRVIIFEPNDEFINKSIDFLEDNLKWAHCIYIFPKNTYEKYKHINKSFFFDNKYEILEFLKKINFNFAYIALDDYSEYKDELTQETHTQGLFYV